MAMQDWLAAREGDIFHGELTYLVDAAPQFVWLEVGLSGKNPVFPHVGAAAPGIAAERDVKPGMPEPGTWQGHHEPPSGPQAGRSERSCCAAYAMPCRRGSKGSSCSM